MRAKKLTKETITLIGMKNRSKDFDKFEIGDTIKVAQRIKEGDKERVQMFEGDVIAIRNNGISSNFTVRKIGSNSIAVERIFPYYAPNLVSISFIRKGKVRRAKLYYIRKRIGKASRVREEILTREQKENKLSKDNEQTA